mmetsp:Transcript_31168/g.47160  ORF Transcript_31168/g.47160 Transcript_31168/m.47160 type:complete len:324 (-) Transcript_31168:56-1027(-)
MKTTSASQLFPTLMFILSFSVDALTKTITLPRNFPRNSRYVCLFDDYTTIRGPYFNALIDQTLKEQIGIESRRIALCTSRVNAERLSSQVLPKIQQDLLLDPKDDCCILIVLDDYNPQSLNEKIANQVKPTIFWIVDDNAFQIRYKMRTSGLDKLVERMCGSDNIDGGGVLYIGENSGALCAGASMATAHALNENPKQAPEPQFFGLGLLGPRRSLCFGIPQTTLMEHPKIKSECSKNHNFLALQDDQIFVWSQPPDQEVACFVFLPCQRGGIEQLTSPAPLPPMVGGDYNIGGVQCDGEPAIDPSRMVQQVGDSEWINEAEG